MQIGILKFQKRDEHAYIFSGKLPWMNKNIDATKKSFETAVTMV